MNENEQLARWLKLVEHQPELACISGPIFEMGGGRLGVPDFRTSNEWAGAVLDKLLKRTFRISTIASHGKKVLWRLSDHTAGSGLDWRSAVVDGALEVIRREGISSGSPS